MAILRLKFLKQNNKDIIQTYNNALLEISACEVNNCSVNLLQKVLAYLILKDVLLVPSSSVPWLSVFSFYSLFSYRLHTLLSMFWLRYCLKYIRYRTCLVLHTIIWLWCVAYIQGDFF